LADIWVNILGDGSKLKGELDKSSKNVTSFSEKIGKIGKVATVAGGIVTAAFAKIVTGTAKVGDQFDKMSLRTGVAVEDLSALAYAADISGTDIGTLEKGLKGLTKVMDDASMGIGEGMEAFELLDIAVTDSEGKLRSTVDVLKEAATKISAIEDPTKQAALAMDLFGARAGPQLLPLLKAGEGGIEDLMNKAKELGITMSTEAATKAAEFTDRMTDLKGSLAGAGRTIGDTLIPAIIPLIEKVTEIVSKVVAWTKENPELVATITKVAAVVGVAAAVGGPILMLVSAFSAVAPAIALIGTIATGPIGLLIIAVTAIIAIWKNWDKIVEFVSGFVEKIKGYLEDLKTLAIQKVTEMIDWIIEKFEDLANLPKKMMDWGKNALSGFSEGIKSKIGGLGDACKSAGNKVKSFFGFESPPKEGPLSSSDKWMPNMMAMFGKGITDNLDLVYEPVQTLSTGFMDLFTKLKDDFKSNIVNPIMGYLEDQLAGAIVGVLSGAADFEWSWKNFWEGLKNVLINAVAAMIAKLVVLAAFKWFFPFLIFEKGGGVGYDLGGQVKKFQFGGVADTIPARLTIGEYVIAKPMTDFIKRFRAIPQNLIDAVVSGMPTPIPAFAGGGPVSTSNISRTDFGETKIYIDIHDNKISDDVDIKRLAMTVSGEILRKINLNRRH
jgi:TP901 family phage tail tape measure protein